VKEPTIYGDPIIKHFLEYDSSTLLIGAPNCGLSALAAYAAATIAGGGKFFGEKAEPLPVILFGDSFMARYLDAVAALDLPAPDGLILKSNSTEAHEWSAADMLDAVHAKLTFKGVYVFDDLTRTVRPSEQSPATLIEATQELLSWAYGRDSALVATLAAHPDTIMLGELQPLAALFNRIVTVECVGPSGRLTVIKDSFGSAGHRATFDLVNPVIGHTVSGEDVRATAVFPGLDPEGGSYWGKKHGAAIRG
jgi:hypothetical protein